MNRRHLVAAAALTASIAALRAQVPTQPEFRAEINLVRLAVRALDDQDRPVTDLSARDLEIKEEGRSQQIATFEAGVRRSARSESISTSASPTIALPDAGRIYLIVVDNYHLSPSQTIKTREILSDFFTQQFAEGDLAAIVVATGGGQDFTTDKELLLAAVTKLRASPLGSPTPQERPTQSLSLLNTLSTASKSMSREGTRRKTVILVSSDLGCGITNCGRAFRETVSNARNAEASIYPLDPDGLTVPGYCPPTAGGGPCAFTSGRGNARSPLSALNVLAQDTGGFVIADTNRITQGLARVIEDGRTSYLISYYSNNEIKTGKIRRIVITTPRKNLRLIYRQSYVVGQP
jgi:VWFA-related protein